MWFCNICQKRIENHDNYLRHITILHSEDMLVYLCPLCDKEFRWAKNFPAHYEKEHHKSRDEGLRIAKSLQSKIVPNKDYQGLSNSTDTINAEESMDHSPIRPKRANVMINQKDMHDAHNQTLSTNSNQRKSLDQLGEASTQIMMKTSDFISNSLPSQKATMEMDTGNKTTVLFSQNVEIHRQEQWVKGTMTLVEETSNPLMIRLSLCINGQCQIDELLTVQSTFTHESKTVLKWDATDFSQGVMQTKTTIVRFKQTKIRDKFFRVWQSVRNLMSKPNTQTETIDRDLETNKEHTGFIRDILNSELVLEESNGWTCPGCFVKNQMDDIVCPCCNKEKVKSTGDETSFKQSDTVLGAFVPFSLDLLTCNVDQTVNEDEKTVLFEQHATLYRLKLNKWVEHCVGNIQIIPNMYDSNSVQLLLHRETDLTVVYDQKISQSTCFDEEQKSTGVLKWMTPSQEQWAVKFNDPETCQQFHDIILVATTVFKETPSDFSSTKLLDEILEFSTKESGDNLKKRCLSVQRKTKIRNFSRDLQTWYRVNAKLGITSETKRRYYDTLCQNQTRSLSPKASAVTTSNK